MAKITIDQLPDAGPLTGAENVALTQGGVTKKADIDTILAETVRLTGDQTVGGIKTFSNTPLITSDTLETSGSTTIGANVRTVFCTSSSANQSITIPAGLPIGTTIKIVKTAQSNHTVTLLRSGSETIEGGTSWVSHAANDVAGTGIQSIDITKRSATAWAWTGGEQIGSNANGSYTRLPNGFMMAWSPSITATAVAVATAHSGGFRSTGSGSGTWTYPAPFIAIPEVFFKTSGVSNDHAILTHLSMTETSTGCALYRVTSGTVDSSWRAFAIGRWR
jgi:hypothetical protein